MRCSALYVLCALTLLTSASADLTDIPCSHCLVLAYALEAEVHELLDARAEAHAKRTAARRGRRAPVSGLTEGQIAALLGGFCAAAPSLLPHADTAVQTSCERLLRGSRGDALEQWLFQHGHAALRLHWCVEVADVCDARQVVDQGEL